MDIEGFLKELRSHCPHCTATFAGPLPVECPSCGFNVGILAGQGTTDFQRRKWEEHTGILQGRDIELHNKEFNASFDFKGYARIDDLVRFTLTYGDRDELRSRGGYSSPAWMAYVPEPIGSGTCLYYRGTVSCSGLCIVSAHSTEYGHAFPMMDQWVADKYGDQPSRCRICGRPTLMAQPVCEDCYVEIEGDWTRLI